MMLIEETTVPDAALPVDRFKAHLRLGTGFGDDQLQDGILLGFLRAAIAAIEARTGKVLIRREFGWELEDWRERTGQVLPVVPVSAIVTVLTTDADGTETAIPLENVRLEPDSQRPRLRPVGPLLPAVPVGGKVVIRMVAGLAEEWDDLPADLGQAVLLLAAHYYEYRHETALSAGCMPFGVSSLIQRYRVLRLGVA
ncbi:head-tail connector protein [Pontibaca salina]|uniref:Phage head-tail connector protein n=1 Tax=Pontibaca salina TaxID=2795731 RepID=A0A934HUE9_9RHOB|nr:head-tail connector protein [Pontibaca salina]MBI6630428.1 phage head-tail connector protein [Pontibaca salina]